MLSKWVDKKGRDWDQQLPYVLWAYQVSPHDSTGESPFFLLHGYDPRLPTELALESPSSRELQQKAWKFSHPYHGPFRIVKLTDSNGALVWPTTRPDDPLMLVNTDCLWPCRSEISDDACWLGTRKTKRPKKPQGLHKEILAAGKDSKDSPPKHRYPCLGLTGPPGYLAQTD